MKIRRTVKRSTEGIRIIQVEHTANYTSIDNQTLRDPRLSYRELGLLCELLSHKAGWRVTPEELAKKRPEGRDAILNAFSHLEEFGYAKRERHRTTRGTWLPSTLYVYERPQPDSQGVVSPTTTTKAKQPHPEKPPLDKPRVAKPPLANQGDIRRTIRRKPSEEGTSGEGRSRRMVRTGLRKKSSSSEPKLTPSDVSYIFDWIEEQPFPEDGKSELQDLREKLQDQGLSRSEIIHRLEHYSRDWGRKS